MFTDLLGDTLFALRLASPLAHAGISLLIFLTGRRVWDARTGFWAGAGYLLAPGVGVSSMIMSTDPVMMLAWAGGLYALVRALETRDLKWWVAVGVLVGIGMLAKYTMAVFFAGMLGYLLFSPSDRDWKAIGAVLLAAFVVILPNLMWNMANNFATITHVAGDADPGRGYLHPGKLAEFVGAQFGVIGPVFFLAIGLALVQWRRWHGDATMRLMVWLTATPLVPIVVLSFLTRAQPNWAAPAYVAGSLVAARWLVMADWKKGLRLQVWSGVVGSVLFWGYVGYYGLRADHFTRAYDPFKKMRIGGPFCELAFGAMSEEGATVLLSDDRRRLSECMFLGGLGWDEIAVWNPDLVPENHHELVATLRPGDDRLMLLATLHDPSAMVAAFDEARAIDSGQFRTHKDRSFKFYLWAVKGFRGYPGQP